MYLSVLYAADEGLHGQNILQLVVDWLCYVFAHNQFAYIEERSNEPLLQHCIHLLILSCSCGMSPFSVL